MVTDSESVSTDTTKLCSDLIVSLSLYPKAASQVGEILAALAREGTYIINWNTVDVS